MTSATKTMAAPSERRTNTDRATSTAATNSRFPIHCQVSARPADRECHGRVVDDVAFGRPARAVDHDVEERVHPQVERVLGHPGKRLRCGDEAGDETVRRVVGVEQPQAERQADDDQRRCTGEERQPDPARVARPGGAVSVGKAQQMTPQADDGDDRDHEAVLELDEHRDDADRRRGLGPAGDEQVDGADDGEGRDRVVLAPHRRHEDDRGIEQEDRRGDQAGPLTEQPAREEEQDGREAKVRQDERQLDHERRDVRATERRAPGATGDAGQPQDVQVDRRVVREVAGIGPIEGARSVRRQFARPLGQEGEVGLVPAVGQDDDGDEQPDQETACEKEQQRPERRPLLVRAAGSDHTHQSK